MSLVNLFLSEPLVRTFTENTRIAMPYLQSLARTSRTQTSIFAELRSAGLTFRDSEARTIIRATRALMQGASEIRGLVRTRPIDPELMPEALGAIRSNFSHVVKVTGTDLFSGERIVNYITVSTNEQLSLNQVTDAALRAIETMPGETSTTISQTMTDLQLEYEEGRRSSAWRPGT